MNTRLYFSNLRLAVILVVGALTSFAGAATVFVSIDNTGANSPVNISNPRTWNFGISAAGAGSITLGSSLFGLNKGVNTVAPIIYSIYSGLGGDLAGNTLLRSVTLQPSDVDGSYTTYEDFTHTDLTLAEGNYSVTLTSTAAVGGNTAYFLKTGKLSLYTDITRTTLADSALWIQDPNTTGTATTTPLVVPEPSHALLLLVGGGFIFLRRRRPAACLS